MFLGSNFCPKPGNTNFERLLLYPLPLNIYAGNTVSRRSSISIMSDYGLDDRAIGVRSPAEAADFSPDLCVQTGSGAHPASYPLGPVDPFPGGNAGSGRDADHSPHVMPKSRMSRSCTSPQQSASMACSRRDVLYFFTWVIPRNTSLRFFATFFLNLLLVTIVVSLA
jgi:hypothetical protein